MRLLIPLLLLLFLRYHHLFGQVDFDSTAQRIAQENQTLLELVEVQNKIINLQDSAFRQYRQRTISAMDEQNKAWRVIGYGFWAMLIISFLGWLFIVLPIETLDYLLQKAEQKQEQAQKFLLSTIKKISLWRKLPK